MSGAALVLIALLLLVALGATVVALRQRAQLARLRAGDSDTVVAPVSRAGGRERQVNIADLQELADTLAIGLLRIDEEGRIALANEAAHRFLGRKQGKLVGRSTMEAFVDHRIDELTRRVRTDGGAQLEVTSGGEPQRTLLVRARRARQRGAVWVVLEDVSELRRLQRIRSEFIDNLSHELRTPLATVRLLTEALALELERNELPARVREAIVQMDVETGHLVQMVGELLDLSRIEQGETRLELEEVDLGQVIERTLERLRPYAERQGVRLQANLPADAAERSITGDEQRLEQLLVNLLHNAVKFSPRDADVTVWLRAEEAQVVLQVEDRGAGIPAEDLERIFERFYKVDRARPRQAGGTGLGLAIARHIVERHGGRIWAESSEGDGSSFFVALPRSPLV